MDEVHLNGATLTTDTLQKLLLDMSNLYIDFYDLRDMINFFDETGGLYNNRCMYHYPADTYNFVNLLLSHNVSDITITEPLAFDMENIANYIHYDHPDCKIRIRPYIGRDAWTVSGDDMCHFWILPQHIHFYEDYVYIVDILATSITREEVLYNVYTSGDYGLDLSALLEHFDYPVPIKAWWVSDATALRRVNCR